MMKGVVEETNRQMSAVYTERMLTPGTWPPIDGIDVIIDDERANSDEL